MHNLFCVFRPRSLSSFILKWIHRKTWILMTSCAFQWWRGLSFLSLSVDCVLIVIVIVLVLCFWHVCFHSLLTFIFQKQKGSSSSSWCEWNKCSGSVYVVNSAYHYHSLLAACLCLSNLITSSSSSSLFFLSFCPLCWQQVVYEGTSRSLEQKASSTSSASAVTVTEINATITIYGHESWHWSKHLRRTSLRRSAQNFCFEESVVCRYVDGDGLRFEIAPTPNKIILTTVCIRIGACWKIISWHPKTPI